MPQSFKAYFISDIHLSSPDDQRAQSLLKFLRSFDGTHLFLMGDIFDLWIGQHSYFLEKWVDINAELFHLHQRGVEIHYFEGNHDLYLQSYFGNQLGLKVHADPVTLKVGPWNLRLEHGDQMDPDDRGYRFLRWFLRTPLMRVVARRVPEKFIVRLGERMSHVSRDYTSHRKTITEAVARQKIRTHAEKVLQQGKVSGLAYDYLIAGHVHVMEDYEVPVNADERPSRAINLGSWLDQPKAFCLTENGGKFLEL